MSTVDFIERGMDFAHRALADARNGTAEQMHFVPERGSHSIAWCLWHTARIEDLIISARVLDQPAFWSNDWAQRTGLPVDGTGNGLSDEEAQQIRISDIDAFAEYQEAVFARTRQFLSGASDEDLEREVPSRTGTEYRSGDLAAHDRALQRASRRDQHPPRDAGHADRAGRRGDALGLTSMDVGDIRGSRMK